jgi:cobalamin transport system permease protein
MKGLVTRRTLILSILAYLLLALITLLITPFIGGETIQVRDVGHDIYHHQWNIQTEIFFFQRIPRVGLAYLVGGSLALVGSVFQVVLRNPLATPYTLGVTGGGALGAVMAILIPGLHLNWGPFSTVQLTALAGASLALGLIYILARHSGSISTNTLLLAGVTVGILCGALILFVRYLASPHLLVAMDHWLMGGLDIIGYQPLAALLPLLLPGAGMLFMQMGSYNLLSLGEEMALGYGVDVSSVQRISLIGGGLVTAGAVSIAGPIGFVGLLVPHAVRRLSGFDHRILLPASFLAGGTLLVICDTIARTLVAPTEMPVGIITALVGGPFFIYLLFRKK